MTWSLIAKDTDPGDIGLIVASKFFAAGAVVPWVGAQVAVASQAFCNPIWGTEGRARLSAGETAQEVLDDFVQRDAGQAIRQAHMMDLQGQFAAHTGAECVDWCGHLIEHEHSVAGNMLVGAVVLEETSKTYLARTDLPFAARLIAAMQAGEHVGGDKRGRQSAALVIHKGQEHPWLSLRADDHQTPLAELDRLWDVAQERYVPFTTGMPTASQFSGEPTREGIDAAIAKAEEQRLSKGRLSRSHAVETP